MKYCIPILLFAFTFSLCNAATSMVGACAAREASIWIKANSLDNITAVCFKPVSPANKTYGRVVSKSPEEITAKIVFPRLSAGSEYKYEISNGVEKTSGTFKTRPDYEDRTPPPDFSFAVLGRNHINDREFDPPFLIPGGEYEIFDAIAKAKPDFAIWVGGLNDLRNADIDSRSGIFARFAAARDIKEVKKLLSSQANYAATARSNFGGVDATKTNRDDALDAFDAFWANPQSPSDKFKAYTFKYADAEFFVLDDVSNRKNLDHMEARPQMLGAEQMKWLLGSLKNSKAKFKIVVMNSPMANPVESDDNFTFAKNERKEFLDFLVSKKIGGVILVSGNKNYGELTRLVRASAHPLFELSAAPLTARPSDEIKDMNYFRVPSSGITNRAFAIVKIDGKENDRAVTLTFFNSKGEQLFSATIKETELYSFE